MNYRFKISRRLAINGLLTGFTVGSMAACTHTAAAPSNLEDVVAMRILPQDTTIVVGDSILFTAVGITSSGDSTQIMALWSVEGGTIRGNGRGKGNYKSDRPGKFKVKGSEDTLTDSTTITVVPDSLDAIRISPRSATLAPGEALQFSAIGILASGDSTAVNANFSATGGTINGAGMYQADSVEGNFRVVGVDQGGLSDSVTLLIAAVSGPPPAVLFHSDWSAGTGSSSDGGKWDNTGDHDLSVVAVSGISGTWPTFEGGNVLKNTVPYPFSNGRIRVRLRTNSPGNGDSQFYRMYLSMQDVGNGSGDLTSSGQHVFEPIAGSCAYGWQVQPLFYDDGTWTPSFNFRNMPTAYEREYELQRSDPALAGNEKGRLLKPSVYRLEFKLTAQDVTRDIYKADIRIYDDAGTLIANASDFANGNGERLSLNPDLTIDQTNTREAGDCIQWFNIGHPGFSGISEAISWYVGGLCIRSDDWCGPYRNGL